MSSLCKEQCPCDNNELCKFCTYCTFCPACSLCSVACAEDSLIRASLNWFDGWKSKALALLGVDDIEVPDLEKVDKELEEGDVERRLRGTRIKLLVDEVSQLEEYDVYVLWRASAQEPDWQSYATPEQIARVEPLAARVLAMTEEEREATWHRLHKKRPELWHKAEQINRSASQEASSSKSEATEPAAAKHDEL